MILDCNPSSLRPSLNDCQKTMFGSRTSAASELGMMAEHVEPSDIEGSAPLVPARTAMWKSGRR